MKETLGLENLGRIQLIDDLEQKKNIVQGERNLTLGGPNQRTCSQTEQIVQLRNSVYKKCLVREVTDLQVVRFRRMWN